METKDTNFKKEIDDILCATYFARASIYEIINCTYQKYPHMPDIRKKSDCLFKNLDEICTSIRKIEKNLYQGDNK